MAKRVTLLVTAPSRKVVAYLMSNVTSVEKGAILLVIARRVKMCATNVTRKATLLVIVQSRRVMEELVILVVRVATLLVSAPRVVMEKMTVSATIAASRVILPENAQKLETKCEC